MQVNQEAYNEELDVEKLDRLIEELRAQAESQGEAKA